MGLRVGQLEVGHYYWRVEEVGKFLQLKYYRVDDVVPMDDFLGAAAVIALKLSPEENDGPVVEDSHFIKSGSERMSLFEEVTEEAFIKKLEHCKWKLQRRHNRLLDQVSEAEGQLDIIWSSK